MNYFKFFSRLSSRTINKRPDKRENDETQNKSKHLSEFALDKLEFSVLDDLPEDQNSCKTVQDNTVPPLIYPSLSHAKDSFPHTVIEGEIVLKHRVIEVRKTDTR